MRMGRLMSHLALLVFVVYAEQNIEKSRKKRLLKNLPDKKWPHGIVPYDVTAVVPINLKDVLGAMSVFEYYTSIRYSENNARLNQKVGHKVFLLFKSNLRGRGVSLVGFHNHLIKGQYIDCPRFSTCVHEMGHALGFEHEQYHPDRDLWVRLNKGNIHPAEYGNFQKLGWGQKKRTHFDFNSFMLYGNWRNQYSKLFPELEFEERHFYMFKELCQVYECHKAPICIGNTLTCENEGYVSVVDNRCTCICPRGLDPENGCKSMTKKGPSRWPVGTLSLLQHKEGCPDGFSSTGMLRHFVKGDNKAGSDALKSAIAGPKVELSFCTKRQEGPKRNIAEGPNLWPPGKYCFFKKGKCPDKKKCGADSPYCFGSTYRDKCKYSTVRDMLCPQMCGACKTTTEFYPSKITFPGRSDRSENARTGDLPDGEFGSDASLSLCCAHTGLTHIPVSFPTEKPFILLAKAGEDCQEVTGMHVREEKFGAYGARVTGDLKTSQDGTVSYIHYCVYTPLNRDCGDIVELGPGKESFTFVSDQTNPSHRDCSWLFKSATEKGTLVLSFEDLKVKSSRFYCEDSVEIQPIMVGQKGIKYCKDEKDRSFSSLFGKIRVHWKTGGSSKSHFKATVRWIPASGMCYNVDDKGASYRGDVDYTRDFKACLPWATATQCDHHSLRVGDFLDGLEDNHCRNPDNAFRPWCYTKLAGCERSFCDVCRIEQPFDHLETCADIKAKGLCDKNKVNCAKTCGIASSTSAATKFSDVRCGQPGAVSAGDMTSPAQPTYKIGDKVTYKCKQNDNTVQRTCLSTGVWSAANTACLPCPLGYSKYRNNCYKFFGTFTNYNGAVAACARDGALVALPRSNDEHNYVVSIKEPLNLMWIGAQYDDLTKLTVASDGSRVTWYKWAGNQPTYQCLALQENGNWYTDDCRWNFNFVCQKPAMDGHTECKDFLNTCRVLIFSAPGRRCDTVAGLDMYCRRSCGLCKA